MGDSKSYSNVINFVGLRENQFIIDVAEYLEYENYCDDNSDISHENCH